MHLRVHQSSALVNHSQRWPAHGARPICVSVQAANARHSRGIYLGKQLYCSLVGCRLESCHASSKGRPGHPRRVCWCCSQDGREGAHAQSRDPTAIPKDARLVMKRHRPVAAALSNCVLLEPITSTTHLHNESSMCYCCYLAPVQGGAVVFLFRYRTFSRPELKIHAMALQCSRLYLFWS